MGAYLNVPDRFLSFSLPFLPFNVFLFCRKTQCHNSTSVKVAGGCVRNTEKEKCVKYGRLFVSNTRKHPTNYKHHSLMTALKNYSSGRDDRWQNWRKGWRVERVQIQWYLLIADACFVGFPSSSVEENLLKKGKIGKNIFKIIKFSRI